MKLNNKTLKRADLTKHGETVSTAGLGRLVGITVTNIKKMIGKGLPCQIDGDVTLFDTVVATKWIIDHKVNEALPADEDGTRIGIVEAKRRFEVARMLTAELALAKEREQLANIDDLMENFIDALVQVRAKVISQSSRLTGILSHQDEEAVTEILETDAIDTLEALSDYTHEYTGNQLSSTTEHSGKNNRSNTPVPVPAPQPEPR